MNDTTPAWLAADYAGPTPPLDEFLAEYKSDDNTWWYLASGHHLNLFDAALDQLEQARAELAATVRAKQENDERFQLAAAEARKDAREWEKSSTFLEGEYTKARDRGNRLAYLIDRAKQVEERPADHASTHDEAWALRNEGFNEARRWFLMLLADEHADRGEVPDGQ